ncbi:DDE-type integrase/transposase/recombinase [Xiamenia xianingshaonis]|uniref:DDE-type integrase/transposase/recombinase n=1 Tax=Xiamenia xianingshaonis TaxID=2682776 RepID=UPI0036F2C456
MVFDVLSRMIVGWAMDEHIDVRLADEALRMGIERRRPNVGLIHHSDHGSQYKSLLIGRTMQECRITSSMGAIVGPWDNAWPSP